MLKIFKKACRSGIVTEKIAIKKIINQHFGKSIAIRHVDTGSCNACELEIHALNNVFYDIERFGIHFVASPKHADILLVTGVVSRNMEEALRIAYANLPAPKLVLAIGDCATNGGEFGTSYASAGAVSNIITVNAAIAGCPPTPQKLLLGILEILQIS